VAYIDRQQGSLLLAAFICTRQHSEVENSLKLILLSPIFQLGQQQQDKFKLKYQHKQLLRKVYFTQTKCMMTNVSKRS
jgi:hypothetical protein